MASTHLGKMVHSLILGDSSILLYSSCVQHMEDIKSFIILEVNYDSSISYCSQDRS